MASARWRNDPQGLGFKLARYKIISKLLDGQKQVLEIGCADGWASTIVARKVQSYIASDFDPNWETWVKNSVGLEPSFHGFEVIDFTTNYREIQVSSIFALDVLEHIDPAVEKQFISNICSSLHQEGLAIFGVPSIESQRYASEKSKQGHVNCKTAVDLKRFLEQFFTQVLILSVNDEMVHLGFLPMSHYLIAICFGKR
jgi:cyclopropane fatty-acyl-phospholipid synthase-like methyltransferase